MRTMHGLSEFLFLTFVFPRVKCAPYDWHLEWARFLDRFSRIRLEPTFDLKLIRILTP